MCNNDNNMYLNFKVYYPNKFNRLSITVIKHSLFAHTGVTFDSTTVKKHILTKTRNIMHGLYNTMMKEHRYSSEIKSIRLQTSLYNSVSQSATPSRITQLQSDLHFCAESPHDVSY